MNAKQTAARLEVMAAEILEAAIAERARMDVAYRTGSMSITIAKRQDKLWQAYYSMRAAINALYDLEQLDKDNKVSLE